MNQAPEKHLPENFDSQSIESKWQENWNSKQVYSWDPKVSREDTFVIDTPPPTVSGSLHVGHVFSFTQTDILVRFWRMQGKNIFYPMGWDDNGLPTERRVQNVFSIRCNPNLPFEPEYKLEKNSEATPREVSRENFIKACDELTLEDEKAFKNLFSHLGLSVDWSTEYSTINEHCRGIAQASFLDLYQKGNLYSAEAPTIWDIDFQSALAQADLEDRVKQGTFYDIKFEIEGGGDFVISTTRPELLVSCVAIVAHPDDERYQGLFGKFAITPVYFARVPILPSTHVLPDKGTGIMMICTFGDQSDVDWWKQSNLPLKQVIAKSGKLLPVDFTTGNFLSLKPELAQSFYQNLEGKFVNQAKTAVVEILSQPQSSLSNTPALQGTPKTVERAVKFYEKGERPVEFITTRQWFIKLLENKERFVEQGKKIHWHPEHMLSRYVNWVEGLSSDWCISRQRYFGVPFPVWYKVDAQGNIRFEEVILPSLEELPVDPLATAPKGYDNSQRNKPNGFAGDPDVMDTWATSSLSPQIMSHWSKKGEEGRHKNLFPMDVRPQSHEIIRTWAFYTIVKAWYHHQEIPWKNVAISGWVLDPDRKKMSKSKGNVITPQHLLDQYSADAVRYWTAKAKLGVDTAFDEKVFQSGKRLVLKLFNASKFVLPLIIKNFPNGLSPQKVSSLVTNPLDQSFLSELRKVVADCTKHFKNYDYASALVQTESLFWAFCDSYVELVKSRAYGELENIQDKEKNSAQATLYVALQTFLKLFSPFLPYITEEIWSWYFAELDYNSLVASEKKLGTNNSQSIQREAGKTPWISIHKSPWPSKDSFVGDVCEVGCNEAGFAKAVEDTASNYQSFFLAAQILAKIHSSKSENQKSLKWPVKLFKITAAPEKIIFLKSIAEDFIRAGHIQNSGLVLEVGVPESDKEFSSEIELELEKAE